MLNDANVLRIYKKEKISDAAMSRYLTDIFKTTKGPEIFVKIVRQKYNFPAGQLHLPQTIPSRKNGRLLSTILIDHRFLIALDDDEIIDILMCEVKNNAIYLKLFNRFLTKNENMMIEKSDVLILFLEMYLIGMSNILDRTKESIKEKNISFGSVKTINEMKDNLRSGKMSYEQVKNHLMASSVVPQWIFDCAEKIAISSGSPKQDYDIDYDVDIDVLKTSILNLNLGDPMFSYVAGGSRDSIKRVGDVDGSKFTFVERND